LEWGTKATGANAVFNHDYLISDHTEVWTLYVRCIPISSGESALAIVTNVRTADYEAQVEHWEALFRGVVLPQ